MYLTYDSFKYKLVIVNFMGKINLQTEEAMKNSQETHKNSVIHSDEILEELYKTAELTEIPDSEEKESEDQESNTSHASLADDEKTDYVSNQEEEKTNSYIEDDRRKFLDILKYIFEAPDKLSESYVIHEDAIKDILEGGIFAHHESRIGMNSYAPAIDSTVHSQYFLNSHPALGAGYAI